MARVNYEQVALYLLTCPTLKEAAVKSGIAEKTLYRLRQKDSFKMVLRKVKSEIFNEAMQRAQAYCNESLEVLRSIMHDTSATDSSRVSASKTILELGLALHEDEHIIERLESLERRLNSE